MLRMTIIVDSVRHSLTYDRFRSQRCVGSIQLLSPLWWGGKKV